GCMSYGSLAVAQFHAWAAPAWPKAMAWGQAVAGQLLHGDFQMDEQRGVGERHLKMVLRTECGSGKLDGIAFSVDRDVWPNPNIRWVELAYKLDLNEFRGNETVQLMVVHLAPR
ncbi:single-stranded-DNA-specific exonuclease RecJ, partial [Pseudomonas syringae]|nr:single-stranded-DNA-specific exonuclease RecJ [Pseudomonas syringae]